MTTILTLSNGLILEVTSQNTVVGVGFMPGKRGHRTNYLGAVLRSRGPLKFTLLPNEDITLEGVSILKEETVQ